MKALFLDIDGVIQSPYDTERFEHTSEMVELSKRLTLELDNGFDYYKYGGDQTDRFPPGTQYDVAAVYYDWRPETVERLRRILDNTGAMIVLSSDWREKGLHVMKGLLNIHGLGKYLYPSAPFYTAYWKPYVQEFYTEKELSQMKNETQAIMDRMYEQMRNQYNNHTGTYHGVDTRSIEIREYLDHHQEITSYVAVDDRNLTWGLEGHFIQTYPLIKEDQVPMIEEILNHEDGPYSLPAEMKTKELEEWREKWVRHCPYNEGNLI